MIVDVVGDADDDPIFPYNEIVCAKIDLTVICIESVVQWKLFFHLHQTRPGVDVVNQVGRQGVHLPLPLSFIKAFYTHGRLVVFFQELDGVDVPDELSEHDQLIHNVSLVQMRFHGLEELEVLMV